MPSKLSQKLANIAAAWPSDPFRPNLQLKTFFQSLSKHPNLTPRAVNAAHSLKDNESMKKVRSAPLIVTPTLFCRELKPHCLQYPLSTKMLEPASVPQHYERLVEAFEKSAQGIGRPWWKVFFGVR